MTLSTGTISIYDVAVELGISASGLNLNDSRVRTLAGLPSGTISFANLQGKTGPPSQVNTLDIGYANVFTDGSFNPARGSMTASNVYQGEKIYQLFLDSGSGNGPYRITLDVSTGFTSAFTVVIDGIASKSPSTANTTYTLTINGVTFRRYEWIYAGTPAGNISYGFRIDP